MRFEGTVKSWNDERGFGFIEPSKGGDEVFVHIKAFSKRKVRPTVGQRVTFEVQVGPQGRKRALNVEAGRLRPARGRQTPRIHPRDDRPAAWDVPSVAAIFVLVAVYAGLSFYWSVSPLWAVAYVMISLVTLFFYAFDKTAAVRGDWRTKETTLLGLGLLGGWPGALLAQKGLRHKSSKRSFMAAFWVTVALNLAAFIALNSPQLSPHLRQFLR